MDLTKLLVNIATEEEVRTGVDGFVRDDATNLEVLEALASAAGFDIGALHILATLVSELDGRVDALTERVAALEA